MSEPTFQIVRNGKVIGSFTLPEVAAKLKDGTILPTDTYWTAGMTEWASVSGLGFVVGAMGSSAPKLSPSESAQRRPAPRPMPVSPGLPRSRSSSVSFGKVLLCVLAALFVLGAMSSIRFTKGGGNSSSGYGDFSRTVQNADPEQNFTFYGNGGSKVSINAGTLNQAFADLAEFGRHAGSSKPSRPPEPTAAEKRAAAEAAAAAAEAQRIAKFEGEIRSGAAALREGLSEAGRVAAEEAERRAKLEAEARAAQVAKAKSEELERTAREAAERRRTEAELAAWRQLAASEALLLASAKKEAAAWVTASTNPEVKKRHEAFISTANFYLVSEIWPTSAEADGNGLTKDERDALSLAQKRVAATSQLPSSVKFTNFTLNRRTTASGSTRFYHIWGELEATNKSGARVVGQWSALLTKESDGVGQAGAASPSSDEVTDAWQSHVLVWDIQPLGK